MKKQYIIIQLETKVSEVPDGYHMTTRTEYFGVTHGYPTHFDTLEEAEKELFISQWDKYTIIPIYTQD
jgi:hypothetical protein